MTETQREPVPRTDSGEFDVALAFLSFARHCVLKKAEGLTEEQLRRVLVPSGTSLLGLVRHLTVGERYWIGRDLFEPRVEDEWDFGMAVPLGRSAGEVLDDYRRAIEESDEALRRVGDPDAVVARVVDDRPRTLRWVLAHHTSEVARHAGHADILRELLDGVTGR